VGHLLLPSAYPPLLGLFGLAADALPRQPTQCKVHQHIAHRAEVVSSGWLVTAVDVHRRVADCAREAFLLDTRDVFCGFKVDVPLRQPKIDDVDAVAAIPNAYQEVVRLDVSVYDATLVHVLQQSHHLLPDHQNSPQAERAAALVELVLQRRSKHIHHHDVVLALRSDPPHERDGTSPFRERLAELGLGQELAGFLSLRPFKFGRHLVAVHGVEGRVDVAV